MVTVRVGPKMWFWAQRLFKVVREENGEHYPLLRGAEVELTLDHSISDEAFFIRIVE